MRVFAVLAAPLVVAGCALVPASPVAVDLTRDQVDVRLSDGTVCTGTAPATGAETGWSGRLAPCSTGFNYVVEIDPGTNPVRFVLEEIFTGLGFDQGFPPIADVTLTSDAGRTYRFVSPPPVEED